MHGNALVPRRSTTKCTTTTDTHTEPVSITTGSWNESTVEPRPVSSLVLLSLARTPPPTRLFNPRPTASPPCRRQRSPCRCATICATASTAVTPCCVPYLSGCMRFYRGVRVSVKDSVCGRASENVVLTSSSRGSTSLCRGVC